MNITCDQCQQRITVHAFVDSDVWERIANGAYALCPVCINERLAARGETAECDLQFTAGKALRSVRTARVERAGAWRPAELIKVEGAGLPALRRGHG